MLFDFKTNNRHEITEAGRCCQATAGLLSLLSGAPSPRRHTFGQTIFAMRLRPPNKVPSTHPGCWRPCHRIWICWVHLNSATSCLGSNIWHGTQEGSTQEDRENHIPLRKGFISPSNVKGREGEKQEPPPQRPRREDPPPKAVVHSPERMIKLINWNPHPWSWCVGGHGAASTSGPGLGGGSCAAPGRRC